MSDAALQVQIDAAKAYEQLFVPKPWVAIRHE